MAWHIAWRSLRRHRTVGFATVLGVTIGMVVIAAILIVDANSNDQPRFNPTLFQSLNPQDKTPSAANDRAGSPNQMVRVYFERGVKLDSHDPVSLPSQKGAVKQGLEQDSPPTRRGEEDYQTMRLAVRVASLLAFSVGAVIVFYTMRFSVAARTREFSLLLCLGEERHNLALSLSMEALLLGAMGTLCGLLLAFPMARALLEAGISTTGRVPSAVFLAPWWELGAIALLSVTIALLGVLGPIRSLYRMQVVDVLQPRFVSSDINFQSLLARDFSWLAPPLTATAWIALRPFLQSWLSVVQFFLVESLFVIIIAVATLWWVRPLLRWVIGLAEKILKPVLPMDALLVGRRMRLTSHNLVFTVVAVTLVFSLLTALHDVTRTLKNEIHGWAAEALLPYVFFKHTTGYPDDAEELQQRLRQRGIMLFRLSNKIAGEFPARLIAAEDVNPYLTSIGKKPLTPGGVILSRTLAARFGVAPGDRLIIEIGPQQHRFDVIEVTDAIGFYAADGQYVDLKSYLLFSDGNPLFASTLEPSLGRFAQARKVDGSYFTRGDVRALRPFYRFDRRGANMGHWQKNEIDRDFLIFDFILVMTVILAAIGVANSLLIQVHARDREFAVFRTLGVSQLQTTRLLLMEGAIIGLVSGLLALVLGNVIGAVSVSFLDRFTLFEYDFIFSFKVSAAILLLTLLTCTLAALYPALVVNRISSAESLHYE